VSHAICNELSHWDLYFATGKVGRSFSSQSHSSQLSFTSDVPAQAARRDWRGRPGAAPRVHDAPYLLVIHQVVVVVVVVLVVRSTFYNSRRAATVSISTASVGAVVSNSANWESVRGGQDICASCDAYICSD
jgi:hypothetical protein